MFQSRENIFPKPDNTSFLNFRCRRLNFIDR